MLLALVLAQVLQPADPRGPIVTNPAALNRYAFFEAFPASGAGTTTACSTTPPTGAKGETLTFSRTGSATCTATATGGLATSGIANGDLVELSGNQPRVEYHSGGVKGLRVEASRVNWHFRFIEYANATWADVGTPTLTGSQASPFTGTYAASAVQFDDNDGAAFEGRSQVVAVTAATAYYAHCYVKAGTATSARISLDGTAATITGLSSSTWSIVEVADASASGATVIFEVDVGSTVAAVGTVTFGGCQVEAGAYRTSIIPTTSAAVTRNAETATFTVSPSVGPNFSLAATTQWPSAAAFPTTMVSLGTSGASVISLYKWTDTAAGYNFAGVGTNPAVPAMGTTPRRSVGADASGTRSAYWDGSSVSAPASSLGSAQSLVSIGTSGTGTVQADGIVSRICLDSNPTRCR